MVAGPGLIDMVADNDAGALSTYTETVARELGYSPFVAVPMAAIGLMLLVSTGGYRRWERMTLSLCGLNRVWPMLAVLVRPDWGRAAFDSLTPGHGTRGSTGDLVFLVVAVVATTIAPWRLFFQQSCVADKRPRFAGLGAAPSFLSWFLGIRRMCVFPLSNDNSIHGYHPVHPLDAPPEQKLFHREPGRMALTPRVKVAFFILQGYPGVMVLLVGWRLIAGS
jgi:hypothetical protein